MPDVPELKVIENPEKYFINRGLFSDHYLQSRLPKRPEWQTGQNMVDFRQKLLALYESQKPHLSKYNEAQTEQKFIKPILDLLGFSDCYVVQPAANTGTPDYALFPNKSAAENAHTKQGETDYRQCIGIADAKYWERNLDIYKHNKKDSFTHKNPSFQIVNYLTGTKITWGILTNGRHWRLYTSKAHMPIANYYEVDLVKLLESPLETLKYFYLLFRKEALLTDANNKTILDRIFEDSNEYAAELENNIKERAYEVVQLICQGFAANFKPDQVDEPTLKQIYDNSLTFLYRLLFVFYAEARDLLPLISNQSYRDTYSIRSIIHKIEDAEKKKLPFSSKSNIYYQSLINLFNLIDSGDPSLNIPEYNGGLFDAAEHPFLNNNTIADSYLVKTFRHLAWVVDKELGFEVMVDYNTLSERHLGSIYEGLLEFKPAIAEEDLVELKEKNGTKYAPAKDNPTKTIICHENDLYLVNDKGERKATGSYYTPEYIVNYIVENTLDALVKKAQANVKALKPHVEQEIKKWQELKELKQGLEPLEKYDKEIAKQAKRMLEPYLSLKVLDPAMGSGHFLTRATDFIAMAIASDPSIESSADLDEEAEIIYYRRRVVESCIYGVDLNPLAVELAKLTLWLSTMAKAKPLSFLNHHLRCGNSLIGAKVSDLDEILGVTSKKKKKIDPTRAPVQIGQFEWAFKQKLISLLKNRALIAELATETLEDIHHKQKWENSFQSEVERFRLLADLWISTHFGNSVDWGEYNTLALNLQSPKPDWEGLIQGKTIQKAIHMSGEKHLFHWELEFPEVFYTEQGIRRDDAGFDAIIGNPPYGSLFDKFESEYISSSFKLVTYREESYVAFMEKTFSLLKQFGSTSFIVPDNWMYLDFTENLRTQVLSAGILRSIVALPRSVFPEATVDTCIYLIRKIEPLDIHSEQTLVVAYDKMEVISRINLDNSYYQSQDYWLKFHGHIINPYLTLSDVEILEKVDKVCIRLDDACYIGYGLKVYQIGKGKPMQTAETMRTRPFTSTEKKSELFLPFFEGESISQYESLWNCNNWINWGPWLAEPRNEKLFEGPRLLFRKVVGNRLIGCYIKEKTYSNTLLYIISRKENLELDLKALLCCLNSSLVGFIFRKMFAIREDDTFPQILLDDMASLPIPRIDFITSKTKRVAAFEQAQSYYREEVAKASPDFSNLLVFLNGILTVTTHRRRKGSDIIHDFLVDLAEEMTRLNKEKQTAIRDFLDWMEAEVLKSPIDEQKNKTKIRHFYDYNFEELEKVLKENKAIPDPCPSDKRNTVLKEYIKAMNVLTPLKQTIKLTDDLIDQIVYKLYGLTPEEIAVVEGSKA